MFEVNDMPIILQYSIYSIEMLNWSPLICTIIMPNNNKRYKNNYLSTYFLLNIKGTYSKYIV